MRNPKWTVDELILALDVYFMLEPKDIVPSNPAIIELSELLRSLPIHKVRPDEERFRNANGVTMVLRNIAHSDPFFNGANLKHGSKLQEKVWSDFTDKREYLHKVAAAIRNCLPLPFEYSQAVDLDERDFLEGSILYQYHRYIETNEERVKRLRNRAQARGRLCCVICNFDYFEVYGDVGKGFMECHHTVDITQYKKEMVIKDGDFALVCSNCHRMLHRTRYYHKKSQLLHLTKG